MNKPHFNKKISRFLCLMGTNFFLCCLSVQASEVQNTQEISSMVQTISIHQPLSSTAQDWGLTEEEWQSYLKWMKGPDGLWYAPLSPAAVLGMRATTETERQHFAEIIARQEHDKVARELTFNHAVYLALRRLYAAEPVIRPFDQSPFNPTHTRRTP